MTHIHWSNNKIYAFLPFLIAGSVVVITILLYNLFTIQQQELKISQEQHIINLYSSYKNNIDTCKRLAVEAKKDNIFIQENCIKPINSSLVGNGLKDWGKSDLLVTE